MLESISDQFPECRRCGSKDHSSEEFEVCIQEHQIVRDRTDLLGRKQLKDCTWSDIVLFLNECSPYGLLVVRPVNKQVASGADLEVYLSGHYFVALKMVKFAVDIVKNLVLKLKNGEI